MNKQRQVTLTDCDCPHDAEFCKHVADVLFAINDQLNEETIVDIEEEALNEKKMKTKKKKQETYKDLIKKASENDLRVFIEKFASRNSEFRNLLTIHFAELFDASGVEKYTTIIRAVVKSAMDRSGYIDYYKSKKVLKPVLELVKKAEHNIASGYYREVIDISVSIIKEINEIIHDMDDSDGNAVYCIESSFEFLVNICHSADAPIDVKEEVFEYALSELEKIKQKESENYNYLIDLLSESAVATSNFSVALKQIDEQLGIVSKLPKSSYDKRYKEKFLLTQKMFLFEKSGKKESVFNVIKENLHLPEFRISLINTHLAKKEYSIAKGLIKEGLNNKEGLYPKAEHDMVDMLLDIAEMEKDTTEVRRLGMMLYWQHHCDMKYYKKVKATFNKSEWPMQVETIINQIIKKDNRYFIDVKNLNNIYIEEQDWERLLQLCEKIKEPESLLTFEEYLKPHFPEKFLKMYRLTLEFYVDYYQGRSHYKYLCGLLEKLSKDLDGKIIAQQLVANWRTQYKMRPAMMQELSKLSF